MSSSKRKSSDNHYENHDDNNDNYDEDNDYIMTDIISTKQITRDYTHKKMKKYKITQDKAEICNQCLYGKLNNKCHCSLNCDTQVIDNIEIKTCVFCTDILSSCECSAMLWALFQCDSCKITHSIYYDCSKTTKETECEQCEKYNNYTQNGCRCMYQNMKYILTDIDIKSCMSYTDYAHTFDKAEFQTVCTQCSCHIAICNCLKDQITEEYMQIECERQNYYSELYQRAENFYNAMDDIYDDEKLNEKIYEKDFKEQMDYD
jgi:hypothetical protein